MLAQGLLAHETLSREEIGEVIKGRLTVDNADGRDSMVLTCEVADGTGGEALAAMLRRVLGQRGAALRFYWRSTTWPWSRYCSITSGGS
mgnify:CR=1 FL=1